MKTYLRTLLATLGHLLVDRFERRVNTPPPVPPQIKPPLRWHRVAMFAPEIPYVHCCVCQRPAPWELADPCPGPRT